MKKLLGMLLSIAMLGTMMTGCGKEEAPAAPAADRATGHH
jgi:hypothetical protein